MDWTKEKAEQAHNILLSFLEMTNGAESVEPDRHVIDALADDLNTSQAIMRLHELRKAGQGAELLASARLMGLLDFHPSTGIVGWGPIPDEQRELANRLAANWAALRKRRDFAAADSLKSRAANAGVELQVTKTTAGQGALATFGTQFDIARLRGLFE